MVEYKEDAESRTIEVTVEGKITNAEYDQALSKFRSAMEKWDDILVLEKVQNFKGIESAALWKDLNFGVQQFTKVNRKLKRCAVVGDRWWIELLIKAVDPLLKAEIKFFNLEEETEAREWLKGQVH